MTRRTTRLVPGVRYLLDRGHRKLSAELLLRRVVAPDELPELHVIPTRLIVRKSADILPAAQPTSRPTAWPTSRTGPR